MPKDPRRTAIAKYERKIVESVKAIKTINEVPLDTLLHVVQSLYVTEKTPQGRRGYWIDVGCLLYPFTINTESFRCRVLGIEVLCREVDNVERNLRNDKPLLHALKFQSIRSWHHYRPEDAGLYMNWALLTEEAKTLLYGK